jgi:hypothetical protein
VEEVELPLGWKESGLWVSVMRWGNVSESVE